MLQQKLTIVPVTLHPDNNNPATTNSTTIPFTSMCWINPGTAELKLLYGSKTQKPKYIVLWLKRCWY